uniref:Uncharacterized protein n=1 Tax=Glossina morsitans morsitans TaxID=37546 RepID=A0A1B0F9C7_GLOMM
MSSPEIVRVQHLLPKLFILKSTLCAQTLNFLRSVLIRILCERVSNLYFDTSNHALHLKSNFVLLFRRSTHRYFWSYSLGKTFNIPAYRIKLSAIFSV